MTERMIKSGDVDICTEAFGDESDTPILLIMGASASMLMWPEELCERLAAAGRFVIRYDNRDTGLSTHYPLGEPDYTVEDMADDAVAVLDAYGIDTAHVVGASMGGMITQQVALRHRDRVRTITPIMSTPDPGAVVGVLSGEDASGALPGPKPELIAAALAQAGVDPSDKQAVIEARVAFFGVLHGPAYPYDEAQMRDVFTREVERDPNFQSSANHQVAIGKTPPWRSRLATLDVPTLVIHGTADPILPYEHGVALAKDIAGAELLTMEGVGHELPGEEMDAIVPAILRHTQS
jgi:pimeloyl-ACP methyl ester carboxylesterase